MGEADRVVAAPRTRAALLAILYVMLLLVVISEARTVFVALAEKDRFIQALPGTAGRWFPVFVATSAAAGITAILVGARMRWAVWLNLAIGLWSILLLVVIGAPAVNALIVLVACAVTTGVPFLTWMRDGRLG